MTRKGNYIEDHIKKSSHKTCTIAIPTIVVVKPSRSRCLVLLSQMHLSTCDEDIAQVEEESYHNFFLHLLITPPRSRKGI